MSNSRIILALDFSTRELADSLVSRLSPESCRLKIGFELFMSSGPDFIEDLAEKGFDVFLDLKLHDIPNTVASACNVAANLGVWMINLHASGGRRMMEAARETLDNYKNPPLLVGVTVITSLQQSELQEVGFQGPPSLNVLRLATLAKECALDGIVCSPREVLEVKQRVGSDLLLVTPGIRPWDTSVDDQKRIMTVKDALQVGSDFLVIGRPVTKSPDPVVALQEIQTTIEEFA